MRIVVKQYNNGQQYILETDNDAKSVITEEGSRQVGQRISAVIEVAADDNEKGMTEVLEAIKAIAGKVEAKRHEFQRPSGNAP
jgi:hypothetical protein